jgi:hypothetical protein
LTSTDPDLVWRRVRAGLSPPSDFWPAVERELGRLQDACIELRRTTPRLLEIASSSLNAFDQGIKGAYEGARGSDPEQALPHLQQARAALAFVEACAASAIEREAILAQCRQLVDELGLEGLRDLPCLKVLEALGTTALALLKAGEPRQAGVAIAWCRQELSTLRQLRPGPAPVAVTARIAELAPEDASTLHRLVASGYQELVARMAVELRTWRAEARDRLRSERARRAAALQQVAARAAAVAKDNGTSAAKG